MSPILLNDFYREVEQYEESKIKSEHNSLKTFSSNDGVDGSIVSHCIKVGFHHIEPNKFGFPTHWPLNSIHYNFFLKQGDLEREREVVGSNGAKTCFMLAQFSSSMRTFIANKYEHVIFFRFFIYL